jgi:GH25 family lysozyme M1 (1,4-beta-N-acetylmuramidase)
MSKLEKFADCLNDKIEEGNFTLDDLIDCAYMAWKYEGEPPKDSPLVVADVSTFRDIDYNLFDQKHLITRATYGAYHQDRTLAKNIKECEARGVALGYYHFYRCDHDPIKQADFFANTVGEARLSDCWTHPICDFEKNKYQDHNELKRDLDDLILFLNRLYQITGVKARIYTGEWLLNWLPWPEEILDVTDLPWVANYGRKPQKFGPWKGMWGWQYTDKNKSFAGTPKEGVDASYIY